MIYNQHNRLIRVEENSAILGEYTYNALGQRVTKTVNAVTTVFHYDFDGNLIGESAADGTFQKEYIYVMGNRFAMVDSATQYMYFYHNDHLGTPVLMTDVYGSLVWEGNYTPFGDAQISPQAEIENNFRFAGQYYDSETELHYNYHRYYDPKLGRYLRADPIGLEGGINPYQYASGNPINRIDPKGLAGIAIDFGGDFSTGWGGEVDPNAFIKQGGTAGTGIYIGAKKDGHAEIGGFTYQSVMTNSGKTPAASLGAGANITIYLTRIFHESSNTSPSRFKLTRQKKYCMVLVIFTTLRCSFLSSAMRTIAKTRHDPDVGRQLCRACQDCCCFTAGPGYGALSRLTALMKRSGYG